jgi:hypothetical protein
MHHKIRMPPDELTSSEMVASQLLPHFGQLRTKTILAWSGMRRSMG